MPFSIAVESVSLSFGDDSIVEDVDMRIEGGEFVSILGPSGCGKTSLLRMVAGLQRPTSGRVSVTSHDAEQTPRVNFVFQEPALLPWRNVIDNVALPLELARERRTQAIATVERALRLVDLDVADQRKYPHMLSGGMRMRASLARAIVNQPDVLLFDEPFAALDDMLRQRLNEDILRLWAEQHWTSLFVTHNVSEAVFLSQRVFVMSARPSTIDSIVDVPFEYPRAQSLRANADFNALVASISDQLRGVDNAA